MILHKRPGLAEQRIPDVERCAERGPIVSRTRRNVDLLERRVRRNLTVGHRVHRYAPRHAQPIALGLGVQSIQQMQDDLLRHNLQTLGDIIVPPSHRLVFTAHQPELFH